MNLYERQKRDESIRGDKRIMILTSLVRTILLHYLCEKVIPSPILNNIYYMKVQKNQGSLILDLPDTLPVAAHTRET